MHHRLENRASSATPLRDGENFDVLKAQRIAVENQEQDTSKFDHTLKRAGQDVPSMLKDAENLQKIASEMQALRHELTQTTHQLDTLYQKHADLPINEEAQAIENITAQSQTIIYENQKEALQKESRFQKVRNEINLIYQKLPETNQQLEDIRTYQASLERETQPIVKHSLGKQVELLETAIISLQDKLANTKSTSPERLRIQAKIQEFSAQQREYQEKKTARASQDALIPELNKRLLQAQDSIQQHESELTNLEDQHEEVYHKRAVLQKELDEFNSTSPSKNQSESAQELHAPENSKIHASAFIASDAQKQIATFDNLLQQLETQYSDLKSEGQPVYQRQENLKKRIQQLSSDHIQVSVQRHKQKEIVDLNVNYLYNESKTMQAELQEREEENFSLRSSLINLTLCNNNLARNALPYALTHPGRTQARIWEEHKDALTREINQMPQGPADQTQQLRVKLQDRLHMAEKLETDLHSMNNKGRGTENIQQMQEWSYVKQLEQQRDSLQSIRKKIATHVEKQIPFVDEYGKKMQGIQKQTDAYEATTFQAFNKFWTKIKEQALSSAALRDEISHQVDRVTAEIQSTHERLKDIAARKGESKHSFFLNEHMRSLDTLTAIGKMPNARLQVFMGTAEATCVPSSILMLCHDHNPDFSYDAHEIADALMASGNGSAYFHHAPQTFKDLGHPIPYGVTTLTSIYELRDKVKFDTSGNPLPFIISIERPDKPEHSKHALVCNEIVDSQEGSYAILRDPLLPNAFAVRLEHLDEVFSRERENAVIPI